jgi:hypothetical protein
MFLLPLLGAAKEGISKLLIAGPTFFVIAVISGKLFEKLRQTLHCDFETYDHRAGGETLRRRAANLTAKQRSRR